MISNLIVQVVPPILLVLMLVLLFAVEILDHSQKQKGLDYILLGVALYLGVSGVILIFIDLSARLLWIQSLLMGFAPYLLCVYWVRTILCSKIEENKEKGTAHPK